MSVQTLTKTSHSKRRLWLISPECAVCGSNAIGINFGVPTCAPCKAFFRRNARRKELLQLPCQLLDPDSMISENADRSEKDINHCSQVRRCTSCRLRRCFEIGMKEELVRSDEEKQRYKQLIELNRQRRQEILQLQDKSSKQFLSISPMLLPNEISLEEKDWRLLSNIVNAYENYCLKTYLQNRQYLFEQEKKFSEQTLAKIDRHINTRINIITSFLSFLSAIPIVQSLSSTDRFYLSKHNIRSLIFPNLHEIEQTCFTDPWQLAIDDKVAEHVYGKTIFTHAIQLKNQAKSILINDPVVTRLWLLILFFSNPLHCNYDPTLPDISPKNRFELHQIQNSFINLLWNYLLHRHGYFDTVRIFSNLIHIYSQMQQVTRAINHQVRTRSDLVLMNQAFNRAVMSECDIY